MAPIIPDIHFSNERDLTKFNFPEEDLVRQKIGLNKDLKREIRYRDVLRDSLKFGDNNPLYKGSPEKEKDYRFSSRPRPLVIIGPSEARHLSCRFLPTRVGFIEAPNKEEGTVCSSAAEKHIVEQMYDFSANKFPNESVVFAFAGDVPFGKLVALKTFLGHNEKYYDTSEGFVQNALSNTNAHSFADKDVFLDVGNTLPSISDPWQDWQQTCDENWEAFSCDLCREKCAKQIDMKAIEKGQPSKFDHFKRCAQCDDGSKFFTGISTRIL